MRNQVSKTIGLLLGIVLIVASFLISIKYGFTIIAWGDIRDAVVQYDATVMEQVVVRTSRLPRALIAISIGGSLAVAGVIMQAVTRNPLASPSVLGINAGASFAIVFAITVLNWKDMQLLIWTSFSGACIAAVTVYVLGSLGREGLSPLRVTLSGSALIALFVSGTQSMLVFNQNGLQDVMFWLAGSIASRDMSMLVSVLPYLLAGSITAFLLSNQLNILLLGEEAARGLGQRTMLVQLSAGAAVVLLAGGAVAVAGPISLVGIIVPHIVRPWAGKDHRWIIPYSAVYGGVLLLLADVAARFIILPEEVPVGIMTAAIGAPFFIYIARKEWKSG